MGDCHEGVAPLELSKSPARRNSSALGERRARWGLYHRPDRLIPSSPSTVSTPSSRALASFEPAPGPATTRLVLAEMDPETLAPSRSATAFASSRVIFSSEPVNTIV